VKIKDKGKEQVGHAHKKTKVHKKTPVYTLTNDDMDHIGYQVRDVMEEVIEEETRRQEEKQKRLQDKLATLQ
jgi:hypothetical protein